MVLILVLPSYVVEAMVRRNRKSSHSCRRTDSVPCHIIYPRTHLTEGQYIRHLWPAGARFVFNMYQHQARLVLRNGKDSEVILSHECVTQGDPLAMIAYGLPFNRGALQGAYEHLLGYDDSTCIVGQVVRATNYAALIAAKSLN